MSNLCFKKRSMSKLSFLQSEIACMTTRQDRLAGGLSGYRRFLLSGMMLPLIVIVVLLGFSAHISGSFDHQEEAPVSRIAFGSCSHQDAPPEAQVIWSSILDFDPQVFIWMGDNIYGDIKRPIKFFGKERTFGPWKNSPLFIPSSEEEMKSRYKKVKSNSGYSLIRNKSKVIGTWDDHDYGLNNAGNEFSAKVINQKLLLDFLDEPLDSSRRNQAGVYASYTFGPVGRQVKVILLDTRYHRDPPFSDGTVLGTAQWMWLEKELYGPPSAITIIGSSIQVVSNLSAAAAPFTDMEGWGLFPKERSRLFKLIADSKRNGVLFISGDVHYGEISRHDCAAGYPLYDITSSGLTRSLEVDAPWPMGHLMRLIAWLIPTTVRVISDSCKYKWCTYGRPNFGSVEIDWDATPVTLKIHVREANGSPALSVNILLDDLRARDDMDLSASTEPGRNERLCASEIDLPWVARYRLTILFFCASAVAVMASVLLVCLALAAGRKLFCKYKKD